MALLARKLVKKICEIQAHNGNTTCLDLGESGRVLVTGGQDKVVNLWAFGSDKCFLSLQGHNGSIMCAKFANNDNIVYSADENGVIKRWILEQEDEHSTFYGHLKSVKSIDCHPFGDYFVSGSNDTSIRLWDIRSNLCIKKYRGHMANVNSVKFSPDGSWIASAGTEGSVIIWDIRMSKQLIEFPEHASPVTCVQFHPYELLLGAGRNDGTVDLYDLESEKIIARATDTSFSGHTVKCITFNEKGDNLFVGSTIGVSVIGWEPDRDLGHVEATWNMLGDMKIKGNQLICGAYEATKAAIYMTPIEEIFRSVASVEPHFESHHPVRRSFSKGSGKLRLSLQGNKGSPQTPAIPEDGLSSPNLSIEMIDEDGPEFPMPSDITYIQLPPPNKPQPIPQPEISSSYAMKKSKTPGTKSQIAIDDLPGTQNDSGLTNYFSDDVLLMSADKNIKAEKEDFPINNAQPPDYTTKPLKQVSRQPAAARQTQQQMIRQPSNVESTRKISNSVSTMELNKIGVDDDPPKPTGRARPMSRGTSPVRNIRSVKKADQNSVLNRENIKNKNISVQIMTKPLRSKSSIDMKVLGNVQPTQIPKIINYNGEMQATSPYHHGQVAMHQPMQQHQQELQMTRSEETYIHQIQEEHTTVLCHLSARSAQLQLLTKTIQGQDVTTVLRKTIEMNDRGLLVDIIGAMLEKTASWSLDMCVLLLPQLYQWLQSEYKFHAIRACDTLREIITKFQPIIQETCTYWGSNIGVDLTREERVNKCNECRQWLLRIKQLPENGTVGVPLTQIQKLIAV
ncbi:katanin p80 WD40 repeat-containing subunit B1 [Culicoides brevitarsis]|uniref:katanin p80 WD40 repeat-containing subunit B1 n=1 Tax=Culicoides brevitarsis TaxID=469753 RepID=UPI00307B528A